jgi:hypothetical protein
MRPAMVGSKTSDCVFTTGTLAGPYQDVPFSVELKDLDYEVNQSRALTRCATTPIHSIAPSR